MNIFILSLPILLIFIIVLVFYLTKSKNPKKCYYVVYRWRLKKHHNQQYDNPWHKQRRFLYGKNINNAVKELTAPISFMDIEIDGYKKLSITEQKKYNSLIKKGDCSFDEFRGNFPKGYN